MGSGSKLHAWRISCRFQVNLVWSPVQQKADRADWGQQPMLLDTRSLESPGKKHPGISRIVILQ
jgi:hypothetical protein